MVAIDFRETAYNTFLSQDVSLEFIVFRTNHLMLPYLFKIENVLISLYVFIFLYSCFFIFLTGPKGIRGKINVILTDRLNDGFKNIWRKFYRKVFRFADAMLHATLFSLRNP